MQICSRSSRLFVHVGVGLFYAKGPSIYDVNMRGLGLDPMWMGEGMCGHPQRGRAGQKLQAQVDDYTMDRDGGVVKTQA